MDPINSPSAEVIVSTGDLGHQFALITIAILVGIVGLLLRVVFKQADALGEIRTALALLTEKIRI